MVWYILRNKGRLDVVCTYLQASTVRVEGPVELQVSLWPRKNNNVENKNSELWPRASCKLLCYFSIMILSLWRSVFFYIK
jgi:hypothetical protein